MKVKQSRMLFGSLIMALAVLPQCVRYEVDSRWPDRVITIDGSDADWENAKVYVEKANISIGVLNDSKFLYVCMASMDRRIATQIMRRGLTVWLDPKGGQNKTFGIHFPLGFQGRDGGHGSMDLEGFKTEFDPAAMMVPEGMTDLGILGPGKKDAVRMPTQVKAGMDSGRIVYELKVPLGRTDKTPHAIGTGPGKNVTVGLETPDFNGGKGPGRAAWRSGSADGEMPQAGGPGEGEPGLGGGRGPGMGGPGMEPDGGRGFSVPEPLRFWVLVHLASQGISGKP